MITFVIFPPVNFNMAESPSSSMEEASSSSQPLKTSETNVVVCYVHLESVLDNAQIRKLKLHAQIDKIFHKKWAVKHKKGKRCACKTTLKH